MTSPKGEPMPCRGKPTNPEHMNRRLSDVARAIMNGEFMFCSQLMKMIPAWIAEGKAYWLNESGKPPAMITVYRYVRKAHAIIGANHSRNPAQVVATHRSMRMALMEKLMAQDRPDYTLVHNVMRDLGRLDGAYPAKHLKVTSESRHLSVEVSLDERSAIAQLAQRLDLALMARIQSGKPLPTDGYWTDPGAIFRASGQTPDPWQLEVLTGGWNNCRLCCSRQAGKSRTMAALAIKTMLVEAPARVVVFAPSEDQSKELIQEHVMPLMEGIGWPVQPSKTPNELSFELQNGSSIEGLPGNAKTNRGISNVRLLIIDEAALVSDELYFSMLPVITVSRGRVIAGSTPYGKRGWFFKQFAEEHDPTWLKLRVRADMCARHTPEFLAGMKRDMGERWYRQEYEASFEDMIDAVFSGEDIDAAMAGADFEPLF